MFQNHELRQRADLAGPGIFFIFRVSWRSIILIKLQTWFLISRLLLIWIIIVRLVIL